MRKYGCICFSKLLHAHPFLHCYFWIAVVAVSIIRCTEFASLKTQKSKHTLITNLQVYPWYFLLSNLTSELVRESEL